MRVTAYTPAVGRGRISFLLRWETAGLAVIFIGISLRAIQYAADTSMSLDEAALGLNVIHRNASHLLDELDFNQGAPPAFLLLLRAAEQTFGRSEYAFRAFPFAAGVMSLVVMFPFARGVLKDTRVAMVAFALFAFSQAVILYSATAKQYEVDVLATLVLYVGAVWALDLRSVRGMLAWAAVGAAAIWISFAAVFVLAAIGSVLIARAAVLQRWRTLALHSIAGAAWLGSFGALYIVSVVDLTHLQKSLQTGASAGPGGSGTLRTVAGAIRTNLGIGHLELGGYDLGTVVAAVAIGLMVIGLATLARDRWWAAALLAAPGVTAVIASELGKYPLFPRTLLFVTPAAIACVAYGGVALNSGPRIARLTAIGALSLVFAFIVVPSLQHVTDPATASDLKPALRYLAQHERPTDTVWIFHATQYGLRYYLECDCFGGASLSRRGRELWPLRPARGGLDQFAPTLQSVLPRFIVSRSVGFSTAYKKELKALRGLRRVWILITEARADFRSTIFSFADDIGVQREIGKHPTGVRLYDLARTH